MDCAMLTRFYVRSTATGIVMSQKNTQELQQMIEALAKRVEGLEDYVRTIQKTASANGIKLPTFKGPALTLTRKEI